MASLHELELLKSELEGIETKVARLLGVVNAAIHRNEKAERGSRVGTDPIPLTPAYDTRSVMSSVSVSKHIQDTASGVSRTKVPATSTPAFRSEDFNEMFGDLSQISVRT